MGIKKIKSTFFPEGILELNEFNKRVINNAPMSVMVIDKNGYIIFVNQYFKSVSSEKNPFLKNIFQMKFFNSCGLCDNYKELLENGKIFRKENCPSNDKKEYLNIVAVPLKDQNGNINGAISMAVDVTDTVLARMKVSKLNEELENKVAIKTKQLLQANIKLKKSLKLKSQFVSDASHELRTPLSIARLNLELLKKQFEEDRESLKIIKDVNAEIDRVADILSDITFFTSIDEKSAERLSVGEIDLNKFVRDLIVRIKPRADIKKINIVFKKNRLVPTIEGDKTKLEKLFLNLITNSIKYGKESGWIKIKINQDLKENITKIIISDNGIGISKNDLPYIFDRFYRANASRKGGEGGFGLGLAIGKWVAEQHKGDIVVKSVTGKGSVFTVILPTTQKGCIETLAVRSPAASEDIDK